MGFWDDVKEGATNYFQPNIGNGIPEGAIIASSLAWKTANKLVGLIPDNVLSPILKKPTKSLQEQFSINPRGDFVQEQDYISQKVEFEDFLKEGQADRKSKKEIYFTRSIESEHMYYMYNLPIMWLQVQANNIWLAMPCIKGFPKITMSAIPNQMPIASNLVPATTNRRIEPAKFLFEFPIAYMGIYGENPDFGGAIGIKDGRNWLDKTTDKLKSGGNWNPINWVADKDIDGQAKGQKMERGIPTYDQVYSLLEKFPSQFGCYLYMGIGSRKIPCSASIQIESTINDVDCIYVRIELTECQEFDFNKLKVADVNTNNVNNFSTNGVRV